MRSLTRKIFQQKAELELKNNKLEGAFRIIFKQRAEQELKNKEDQSHMASEKIKLVTEKLDMSEQKLLEFASMPDIEDQLKDRMEALQQAQERQGIQTLTRFETQFEIQIEI